MSVEVIRHILRSAKNGLKLLKRERSLVSLGDDA